jgi:hypothetical protein
MLLEMDLQGEGVLMGNGKEAEEHLITFSSYPSYPVCFSLYPLKCLNIYRHPLYPALAY